MSAGDGRRPGIQGRYHEQVSPRELERYLALT
jgi:hypothetical protein